MKKRIIICIFSITYLLIAFAMAKSEKLIFSDDFERADIGGDWTTGAFAGGIDTIAIVGGRVQATENFNFIETVQEFSGNLRIEVDVEKDGLQEHSCWDFAVLLKELNEYAGILRFDFGDSDGAAIGVFLGIGEPASETCGGDVIIDGSAINKGKAIFTYQDGTVGFSFENDDGDIIDVGSVYAGNFDSSRIRIYLAGYPDTPTYVDNVRVYTSDPAKSEKEKNKKLYPIDIPQTGQTVVYHDGDDGDLRMGVAWPDPRFTDNGDGTVTDNLTGLIWLQNANCPNMNIEWSEALTFANSLYDGWTGDGSGGDCGLSDGSSPGEWRLPNLRELYSLIDFGNYNPALPSGHPFTNLPSDVNGAWLWSSTVPAFPHPEPLVWVLRIDDGFSDWSNRWAGAVNPMWPVRGGN